MEGHTPATAAASSTSTTTSSALAVTSAPMTRKQARRLEQPTTDDPQQQRDADHSSERHQPRRRTTNADAAASDVDNTDERAPRQAGPFSSPDVEMQPTTREHATSPASRCDNNSLSLVFACLNSHDFASAMKVSRQWLAVSAVNTAWPSFSLPRLIDQLQNDDYDNPTHRRLTLMNHTVHKVLASPIYSKVNDVVLLPSTGAVNQQSRNAMRRALLRLARLPHLTAINCTLESPSDDTIRDLAAVLSDRLHVLVLTLNLDPADDIIPVITLGGFHQLRVLVVNTPPDPCDLMRLVHLEYLHVRDGQALSPDLMHAVRYLSTQHRLRTISLDNIELDDERIVDWSIESLVRRSWPELRAALLLQMDEQEDDDSDLEDVAHIIDELTPLPVEVPAELPPAKLTSLSLAGTDLEPLTFESVCLLPSLVRLECSVDDNTFADDYFASPNVWSATTKSCLQRLTHLRISSRLRLSGMSVCASLRSLRLDFCRLDELGWLGALPHLESLSLRGNSSSPSESTWAVLRQCTRLQQLNVSVLPIMPLSLVALHLAGLPEFRELSYQAWPWRKQVQLDSSFAGEIARSSSWHSLYLYERQFDSRISRPAVRALDVEASNAQLRKSPAKNDAINARFRVYDQTPSWAIIYRIRRDARGRRAWVITE